MNDWLKIFLIIGGVSGFTWLVARWAHMRSVRCAFGWHDFPFRWKRLNPETCKCRRCKESYL